ncbi:hypothetical protein I4U23_016527 [Adineta vaga]|nr:hypothetical protein I4U23_016527 [Adineta vaga]
MPSLDDIQFADHLYRDANMSALLLYELNGVGVFIELSDALIMRFIQVFYQTILCQNRINRNLQQDITLFAYDENMYPWLPDENNISHNLKEINIFCHNNDELFVIDWISFCRIHMENIKFNICTFENLNDELLSFGLKYIRKLRQQFANNNDIFNQLNEQYHVICDTLERNASNRTIVA